MEEEIAPLSHTLCSLMERAKEGVPLPSVRELREVHCVEELAALTRAYLTFSQIKETVVERSLLTLFHEAIGECLGEESTDRLRMRLGPDIGMELEKADWFLSGENSAIRNRAYRERMALIYLILQSLVGEEALECLGRVPLPGTELERLAREVGLSPYLLQAVYDFHMTTPVDTRLLYIVCTNREIAVVNSALASVAHCTESEFMKRLLTEKTKELLRLRRRGEVSKAEMDAMMVHHFLGWAKTYTGHAVYVYYKGPTGRTDVDLSRVENWRLVKGDFLRFFHTRFGKDFSSLTHLLNSSDVTETRDGHRNPLLDVRYVVNRWCRKNVEKVALIRQYEPLLSHGEDLLLRSREETI